jgi:predicted glycoside hydrolase/deacetylase ChbG (UPF0249 family)
VKPNPALKKLGFADQDRIAIIHTDDIGMCQASTTAFSKLWEFGIISSAATMVPCPWFLEAAAFCREHPDVDMGVHLTLTSEWETYRWGPLSTRDPASGLLDEEGCFFRSSEEAQEHGESDSVQRELQAQVDRAIKNGITPTHMDTHMGSVAHPKFIAGYLQSAVQYGLPPMIMRMDEQAWLDFGLEPDMAKVAAQMVTQLEEQGIPLVDRITGLELVEPTDKEGRLAYAMQSLDGLEPGITHFIIHPSEDTPELRAITPDWACRVADFHTFMNQDLKDHIQNRGIHVIGYQVLKDLMPGSES